MNYFSFFFISENRIISNKTIELGNTLKLKWNLNSIQKNDELIVGHSGNKLQLILRQKTNSYNESVKMSYYGKRDDPNQNRISGYLNLVNGNGTLTLNVKNIQYNESGDYVMFASWKRFFSNGKTIYGIAISVIVKGKTGPCQKLV